MKPTYTNKNAGLHFNDPDYDDEWDEDEAYDAYLAACDERHDRD